MTPETFETKSTIDFGELAKVNSAKEIMSIASNPLKMFPDARMLEEAVSRVENLMPITCIAFSVTHGMPVIIFFQDDFYGKSSIAKGKQKIVYAYIANICIPEYSDYVGVFVKNIDGKYYYIP